MRTVRDSFSLGLKAPDRHDYMDSIYQAVWIWPSHFPQPDLHMHLFSGYSVVLRSYGFFLLYVSQTLKVAQICLESRRQEQSLSLHCKLWCFLFTSVHVKKFLSSEHAVVLMFLCRVSCSLLLTWPQLWKGHTVAMWRHRFCLGSNLAHWW